MLAAETPIRRYHAPNGPLVRTTLVRHGDHLIYQTDQPLRPYPVTLLQHLWRWRDEAPETTFLAERGADDRWQLLSFRDTADWVESVARWLLDAGARFGEALLLIDRNSLGHAVLALAAMRIGLVVVPLSPLHADSATGRARIDHIRGLLRPRFAYVATVADGDRWLGDKGTAQSHGLTRLHAQDLMAVRSQGALVRRNEVEHAIQKQGHEVDGNTVAKILFTSGSTGQPKGVIHTQTMLCAQQQQMAQLWPFLETRAPVLCDWLPWHHTSGGNNSLHMCLRNGGSLFIDDGRPTVDGTARSAQLLQEVLPTWYTNVPLGYAMLLPRLEADLAFAEAFFSRLDLMVYGGAALSESLWTRIDTLCRRVTGRPARWASGWGMTETTSTITVTPGPVMAAGQVGVPLPGMQLKLTPFRGLYAVAVRGPNVTPGYVRQERASAGDGSQTAGADEAFDDEGYLATGDLVSWVDAASPDAGLRHEGRLSESFKLGSGTWVVPGRVRAGLLISTGPILQDAVVAGEGGHQLLVFLWLNEALALRDHGWSASTGLPLPAPLLMLLEDALRRYNLRHPGSSEFVARACVLVEAPNPDHGELTDKGSIHQRGFLARRSERVERALAALEADRSSGLMSIVHEGAPHAAA